jgi:hypothetical protein
MSKMATLKSVLNQPRASADQPVPDAPHDAPAPPPAQRKAPSRDGLIPFTTYLSPDYKASLLLIQAKQAKTGGVTIQKLMAEALNDLFEKYRVPVVRQD